MSIASDFLPDCLFKSVLLFVFESTFHHTQSCSGLLIDLGGVRHDCNTRSFARKQSESNETVEISSSFSTGQTDVKCNEIAVAKLELCPNEERPACEAVPNTRRGFEKGQSQWCNSCQFKPPHSSC